MRSFHKTGPFHFVGEITKITNTNYIKTKSKQSHLHMAPRMISKKKECSAEFVCDTLPLVITKEEMTFIYFSNLRQLQVSAEFILDR